MSDVVDIQASKVSRIGDRFKKMQLGLTTKEPKILTPANSICHMCRR